MLAQYVLREQIENDSFERKQIPRLVTKIIGQLYMVEAFDVSNNQFSDTFPSWLENLQNLELLILRSNQFYGKILESLETNYEFPNLWILDLSYNIFTRNLPFNCFRNWNASRLDNNYHLTYIQEKEYFNMGTHHLYHYYNYSMKITNSIQQGPRLF